MGESIDRLTRQLPRHTCFVARPEEAGREFVAEVHRLTRKLDDDPYADTFWGILTGYDAANALRIAEQAEPLTIRRVASGTELPLEMVEEGVWYCELQKNRMVRKSGADNRSSCRGPTTPRLPWCNRSTRARPSSSSPRGTPPNEIGRSAFATETVRSGARTAGLLRAGHSAVSDIPISSAESQGLPAGGELPDGTYRFGRDAMALAWLNSAGVNQMIGYTVPTWFGYAGWGCLDYFVEQPGRFTLTEAFFANQHALIHRLQAASQPGEDKSGLRSDVRGLSFDRDVVAFYGDPAWQARLAPGPVAWQQKLTIEDGLYELVVVPERGAQTFQPINTNGSQRGYRPIIQFLPHRIRDVELVAGQDLNAVIADDFVLIPVPRGDVVAERYRLSFRAKPCEPPVAGIVPGARMRSP